jgi:putative ABC transport system permease protein
MRQPGFSLAAIGSLALGIGLTTTLFSVVNAVLFRETPVSRPDRLAEVYTGNKDLPDLTSSYPDYLAIKDGADAFQGLAAHSYVRAILSAGDRPRMVTGEAVTANYFGVLGIPPVLGRGFRDDENVAPGAVPVAVLSYSLWQREFGGRDDVLGKPLVLSGLGYTIVGVAPPSFHGTIPGIPTDLWVPVMMVDRLAFSGVQWTTDDGSDLPRLQDRGRRWLFVKGRLADGRTFEQARSQVEAIFSRLRTTYPTTNEKAQVSVLPAAGIRFHPMLDGYVKAASAGVLVAVGLVLLIACANVANMLLARATARRRELAIRAAIGAGRGRIIRQLLTEGLILAGAGGVIGALIATWAGRAVSGFGTGVFPIPVDFNVSVDRNVLIFAIAVSLATALLFGLAPAWSASKLDLVQALKDTLGSDGRRRRWLALRDVLVVGQLALSLVLLVAGALLVRGLLVARGADIGYDPIHVASLSFNLQMNGYDVDRAMALRQRAVQELRALPGVVAVSVASRLPLSPDINMDGIKVRGHEGPEDDATPVDAVSVGADYFQAVGVPIVAGRAFTSEEVSENRPVAIVNETLARQYWPGRSAIGQLIYPGDFDQAPFEVIGVARDHKVRSVAEDPRPYLHEPAGPSRSIGLVVRTAGPAESALPMLRQALWQLEPTIVFTEDVAASQIADTTMAPTRIGAWLMAGFGTLALLLAAMGLYGVIAYSVSLRTREVGLRMALGASRGHVLRTVLAQGGRLAIVGIGVGTLASLLVGRVLSSLLYGVSPFDPAAYTMAAAVLLLIAGAANLAPALAAARIDPLRALRRE